MSAVGVGSQSACVPILGQQGRAGWRRPVNVVQRVMGHANASTLNRYTHAPTDHADVVRAAFDDHADDQLTFPVPDRPDEEDDGGSGRPVPA